MTTFKLDLDYSHEMTFGALADDITPYNLTAQINQLEGPAGGNPLITLIGQKSDIISYLSDQYGLDDDDVNYYAESIYSA